MFAILVLGSTLLPKNKYTITTHILTNPHQYGLKPSKC